MAAVLAWLVVLPFGGAADDYDYYAPLGAVVSVSTSVTRTLRASGQAFLALVLGAVLGVGAQVAPLPALVALGLVVAVGTLVSHWSLLGPMAGWVPIAALFILVLGGADPWRYAGAYLGLTTLGALIGVLVSAAVPPLQLASDRREQAALRDALAEQLHELAGALERDPLPTAEEWDDHRSAGLEARAHEVREQVARAEDGPPINWRVQRWQELAARQARHGRSLVNLASLVEELTRFLADRERADLEEVALGPTLRPSAAHALRATAVALRSVGDLYADPAELRRADRATEGFAAAIRSVRRRTDRDQFAAGTLLTGIRRVLASVTPL